MIWISHHLLFQVFKDHWPQEKPKSYFSTCKGSHVTVFKIFVLLFICKARTLNAKLIWERIILLPACGISNNAYNPKAKYWKRNNEVYLVLPDMRFTCKRESWGGISQLFKTQDIQNFQLEIVSPESDKSHLHLLPMQQWPLPSWINSHLNKFIWNLSSKIKFWRIHFIVGQLICSSAVQ